MEQDVAFDVTESAVWSAPNTHHLKIGGFDLPVFICHYRPNTERRAYLEASGLEPNFVTDFDKEEIADQYTTTDDLGLRQAQDAIVGPILPTMHFNIMLANSKPGETLPTASIYNQIYDLADNPEWRAKAALKPTRSPAEISLFLKHIQALRWFASTEASWGLIAEDDIILKEDSLTRLGWLLEELSDSIDYVDLGGGANLRPDAAYRRLPHTRTRTFVIDPPSSRTTCAYLVNRRFASKVVAEDHDPVVPIDWYYNYLMWAHDARALWAEPPLFVHGSEQGFYKSNIR
jgi:GR25 family glycosyltransferase involved in LPS biosynthesis